MEIRLTFISTAEISTGLCCVCLPTLAVLHHRHRRRPSASILKRAYHSAHSQRHALTLNERTVHDSKYIELQENSSKSISITIPTNAVVTEISGGAESTTAQSEGSKIHDLSLRASEEQSRRNHLRLNIVKTVGIEQSYV